MTSPTPVVKRKCPICDKEYDLTEYFLHLSEENLKQLLLINETLTEVKDVMELTYTYMQEDDEIINELAENEKKRQEINEDLKDLKEELVADGVIQEAEKVEVIPPVDMNIEEAEPTRQHISVSPKKPLLDAEFYTIVQKASIGTNQG
jgi:hypothetical protein